MMNANPAADKRAGFLRALRNPALDDACSRAIHGATKRSLEKQ